MRPLAFKESNTTLYANLKGENILDLDVYKGEGQIISLWELSWKERLQAFFRGRIWVHTLSTNTQPPINLQTYKTPFGS